jgi:predicted metal-dependent phosphoesterase TrpH
LIIDLHVHTEAFSSDSNLDPEEAIKEAKRIGLDGICFSEHNRAWEIREIRRLSQRWDFLVVNAVEVDTAEGHVLVFGLHRDFERTIRVHELRKMANQAGGVMIAAHPFKSFRVFGVSDLSLSPEQASQRPIFESVDALEGFSGKTAEIDNILAQEVARMLGMNMTGGSDAHSLEAIGKCVTIFENNIKDEAGLIQELKRGRFEAAYFRKQAE